MQVTPIILAAGQGVRMRSTLPKVLHHVAGRPLIAYSLAIARELSDTLPVVVVGHGADQIRQAVGAAARFALQEKQLGTADAVRAAENLARGTEYVVVFYADMPLLKAETIRRLVETQRENSGPVSMLTVSMDDPHGFGRIVRNADDTVAAIVEEAQAAPEILAIRELNVGAYCFSADWLWNALSRVEKSPKGEYYLTDTIALARQDNQPVRALVLGDPDEALGINTRVHLAEAEAVMRRRINTGWMAGGVTLIDPSSTYIEAGVTLGADTVIWPNSYLRGNTVIGCGCEIGPNTIIEDSTVGDNSRLLCAVLEGAVIENEVSMGPFVHLRKGAHLARGVHMGNFGEVKDSYLGQNVKMGHFSYIGNATIGEDVNIGAGTITCNYDGQQKYPTVIGARAFIGSDTMLVAPVSIGENARTGAGAVVTHDVPPNETVVGVPARPLPKKVISERE